MLPRDEVRHLSVHRFGPVREAGLELGDLTVLVGPQATGKSLLLQTLVACVDIDDIVGTLKRYGYDLGRRPERFPELYYGEGMGDLAGEDAVVEADGERWDMVRAAAGAWSKHGRRKQRAFVVPAQRVLVLGTGWPQPFMAWPEGVPYAVRRFGEDLRQFLEQQGGRTRLFPAPGRWRKEERTAVAQNIFHGGTLEVEEVRARRRVVLRPSAGTQALPVTGMSAGQREFVPLLLGLYHLQPPAPASRRGQLRWAVVEEPESGLHPRAVAAVTFLLLGLLHRRYRVAISTHSVDVLHVVWAVRAMQRRGVQPERGARLLCKLLGVPETAHAREVAEAALRAEVRVHFLRPGEHGSVARDISHLDPGAEDADEASWGALTAVAERALEAVAEAVEGAT